MRRIVAIVRVGSVGVFSMVAIGYLLGYREERVLAAGIEAMGVVLVSTLLILLLDGAFRGKPRS